MRRAYTLASSSALSRALLASTEQHKYITLFNGGSSRRWFSTSKSPADYSRATKFSLTLGSLAAASVAVGSSSLLVEEEAYAKEPVKPDLAPKDVVLYQYEACPFCNKVKAFLDYYDVPYKVVDVNPFSKKEIKWSEYKKVPILMVDGEPLVDFVGWVDDHLVHMLSPNIYRNTSEALESFDYIANNGNSAMHHVGIAGSASNSVRFGKEKRFTYVLNDGDDTKDCACVNCLAVLKPSKPDNSSYLFTWSHDGTLKRWELNE